jgi:hypothetical protein
MNGSEHDDDGIPILENLVAPPTESPSKMSAGGEFLFAFVAVAESDDDDDDDDSPPPLENMEVMAPKIPPDDASPLADVCCRCCCFF